MMHHSTTSTNTPDWINQATPSKSCLQVCVSMDFFLGHHLDDCLFKLRGTDQLVWIPQHQVAVAPYIAHSYVLRLNPDNLYSCARMVISNPIRMGLIDQHQVKGKDLMPYLRHEVTAD